MSQTFKPNDWVRIRRMGSSPHHVGGQIVAVNKTTALIRPIAHRRLEVVELSRCRLWKSRNETRLVNTQRTTGNKTEQNAAAKSNSERQQNERN